MIGSEPATSTGARLVPNDGLEVVLRSGEEHLRHPREGTVVRLTAQVRDALASPTGAAADRLRRLRFLALEDDHEVVASGIARRSEVPLGDGWHLGPPATGWVAIGCAFATGARADANPAAGTELLRAGLSRRLASAAPAGWSWHTRRRVSRQALAVRDYGDVLYDDATDTAELVHARLGFAVRQVCADGGRPLVLGGDHSLGFPTIDAVLRESPGTRVVHLDAHADRAPRTGARTAHCGDFVTWLTETHPDVRVMTIGVRGFDSGFPGDDGDNGQGVEYVTAQELRHGDGPTALRRFVTGRQVHLTVDADVLDPAYAPEVAYPVPGGLDVLAVHEIVRIVASSAKGVIGADFSEVCAGPSMRNAAASAMTQIISSLLDRTAGDPRGDT